MSEQKPIKLGFISTPSASSPCCTLGAVDAKYIDGTVSTPSGEVPRVKTKLELADHIGTIKARSAIGRMDYKVSPGLYAAGNPTAESPVMVSANYKLSFDALRKNLAGLDSWILVLDTKGINVWCAAGKGTFGTDQIVAQVESQGLQSVVSHKKLIVPQLGAPGVNAKEVRQRTGFKVLYGPVRAADIKYFVDSGMKASRKMRTVTFNILDRLVLIPVEAVTGFKHAVHIAAALMFLAGFGPDGYALARVGDPGVRYALLFVGSFVASCVLGPALLPWLFGRAFALKGLWVGIVLFFVSYGLWPALFATLSVALGWLLIVSAVSSYVVMNFTGATTYTSLSGVMYEMKAAVPAQIAAAVIGVLLYMKGV